MNWNTLPGFVEKYSRITVKQHKTFDGKVIEVLYGAQDENGEPVSPKEAGVDGCGRWFGIETANGTTMFVWQHPSCDGGNVEYGTEFKDEALARMEDDIRAKMALAKDVETLVKDADEQGAEQLKALQEQLNAMTDWKTPKEEVISERIKHAAERFNERLSRIAYNKEEKEKLVEEAKKLSESTDWRNTQDAFRDLQNDWRDLGYAGKTDDDLWDAFKGYQKAFNNNRRDHFSRLDEIHKTAAETKTALIEETKKLTASVKNWKDAGNQMNELMNRWKAAGSAGKETDDALWAQFSELRKNFFDARQDFFKQRSEDIQKAVDAKNELIAKAKEIIEKNDFSKNVTDAMKALDVKWREAGYAGKENNDRLWEEFKNVKEEFWTKKREDNKKRFQDIIDRKKETIRKMREEIEDLEIKKFETEDFDRIRGYERRVDEKKETIESLTSDIADLEKRLNK